MYVRGEFAAERFSAPPSFQRLFRFKYSVFCDVEIVEGVRENGGTTERYFHRMFFFPSSPFLFFFFAVDIREE